MKLKNMVSFTEFARNIGKFTEAIQKDDVVVIKNNKPIFVAVKSANYERVINDYEKAHAQNLESLGSVITKIRENKEELKTKGIKHVYIFGSIAKGTENESSDIDIYFETSKKSFEAVALGEKFIPLFERSVIAVPMHGLKAEVLKKIQESSVNVY